MKIFVVLVLTAFACADDTLTTDLTLGGIEGMGGHEIIPPPPGFEGGLIGTLGSRLLKGEIGTDRIIGTPLTLGVPTRVTTLPTVRGEHYDAPIYSSPPLTVHERETVGVIPTTDYYKHRGLEYIVVPPSRTSSGELLYSHAAPATTGVSTGSGYQYLYSPAPVGVHTGGVIPTTGGHIVYSPPGVHTEVFPTGTQYLYGTPAVHSGVIPTTGTKYLYSPPEGLSGVIPTTGTKYLYSPPGGLSGVIPTTGTKYLYTATGGHSGVIPTTGTEYLYGPPKEYTEVIPTHGAGYVYSPPAIGTTGGHIYPSLPLVKVLSGTTHEVEHVAEPDHKLLPLFRDTTIHTPRNGASVFYGKWQ